MGQPWPDPNFQELHIVKHFLQFIRTQLGQPIILVSLIPGALLLFWRVWTFILKPALHPDEPKELPYWIPCKWSTPASIRQCKFAKAATDIGSLFDMVQCLHGIMMTDNIKQVMR